ncbi:MAG: undecaprenyldiphospho-muramoylpentapeptide beta-N-acetylglucosaminyltransferase [Deltaproteobacteria bacterium]|nr:undecaprenyldiphospho-muramoylpentapeptide beta-N-acetylglucosaminyltransferase [Deltaproteobacteria bacterium]
MINGQRTTEKGYRIIIAGGGTGGHLFPGIAIADELTKRLGEARILFVVGRKRMEEDIISRAGYEARPIDVEGILGKGIWGGLKAISKIVMSSFQSLGILRDVRPHLVVGVGGYSSGPLCLMAWILGIPTAIHEQNSYPGLTNRLLAPLAKKIFISFEDTGRYFKEGKIVLTGNPVRQDLMARKPFSRRDNGRFVVLVVGGSQGARAINRAVVDALKELKEEGLFPFAIHQTGTIDLEKVLGDYRAHGIDGEVTPFIEDMTSAYGTADLVICRAGATTIAELAALGKPSILVPFPYATHDHQVMNANSLLSAGGADMILEKDLTGGALAGRIKRYMQHTDELERMSTLALKAGRPRATEAIVDHLMELMKEN